MTRLLSAIAVAVFAVAVLLAAGCTTTRTIRRPETVEELQALVWKKRAHITLLHGDAEGATSSPVPPSLVSAPASEGDVGVPLVDLANLRGYEVKRRGVGALEGLGLGTLIGFLGGAMIGLAMGNDPPCQYSDHGGCWEISASEKALFLGGMGAIGGHALGPIIGALVGHTDRYVFSNGSARP